MIENDAQKRIAVLGVPLQAHGRRIPKWIAIVGDTMKIRSSVLVSALLAACAAGALAQQKTVATSGTLQSAVKVGSFDASPIDTRNFFPQINNAYVFHPIHPENPQHLPQLPGVPNNLKAGTVGNYQRVGSGSFFPAIGATGWTPPDPCMAVSSNYVVASVNSTIAFFDRQGNMSFEQTSADFFAGLGATSFQYDPKCRYDRAHDRFVIVYLEEQDSPEVSKVLFAVSATNNPNGVWYRYRLEAKLTVSGNDYWLDYPGFGYNKDAYAVCGNMFGFTSGWAGVQFLVIPASPVLSGGAATLYSIVDPSGASCQISEVMDTTFPMIYACSVSGSDALRLYAIETPGAAPTITFTSVGVPDFQTPGFGVPSTSNETVDPLDGRIFNCVLRNSHLVAAHCIEDTNSMLVSRWYDIDMSTWPTLGSPSLVQSGNVGSDTVHYFSPAINMNAEGDIGMIFSGASTTVTADTLVAGRMSDDPLGAMGQPATLQSSPGDDYNEWRWGDFFACCVDPVDDKTFWGISMDVAASGDWETQIFTWVLTSQFPKVASLSISPNLVLGGSTTTGTLTLTGIAPPGGMKVSLSSSNNKAAMVPSSASVKNGVSSVTFTIGTRTVVTPTTVTITAKSGSSSASAQLTVGAIGIQSLTLNPTSVGGGTPSTGTVVLGGPAPAGGSLVTLAVDNSSAAQVPWSLLIPPGQTTATFTVTTFPVSSTTTVTVRAASPGPTVYAQLTVTPVMAVSGVSVVPATVKGGNSATGTVSLTLAAPNNLTVTLTSSDPAASVPQTVTVKKGAKSASFSINTSKVKSQKVATITATYGSTWKSGKLTINP